MLTRTLASRTDHVTVTGKLWLPFVKCRVRVVFCLCLAYCFEVSDSVHGWYGLRKLCARMKQLGLEQFGVANFEELLGHWDEESTG